MSPSSHRSHVGNSRVRLLVGWTLCGRATRPHGSGSSNIPANGFAVWQGRCFAVTPRSGDGKRPTTCSWKRSPDSTAPWRPCSPSPQDTSTIWRRPRSAACSSTCLAATTDAEGLGSHHDTAALKSDDGTPPRYEQADASGEPCKPCGMDGVPRADRGAARGGTGSVQPVVVRAMTHEQAAEVLGVTARTVRRRWQDARYRLCKARMGEPLPTE